MNWLKRNYSWMLMLAGVVVPQLVLFGNIPGRVNALETKVRTLEHCVALNNEQHATIIQMLANNEKNLQRLLDLHVKP